MAEKLKPCPFCGGKAILKYVGNEVTRKRAVHIGCSTFGCTVEIRVGTIRNSHAWCEGLARGKWNNRPDIRRETIEACEQVISDAITRLEDGPYGKDIEDVIAGVLESCKARISALKEE